MAGKKNAHGIVFDDATEAALDWLRATTSNKAVTLIKLAVMEYAVARGYGGVITTTNTTNPPGAVRAVPKPGTATPKGTLRR